MNDKILGPTKVEAVGPAPPPLDLAGVLSRRTTFLECLRHNPLSLWQVPVM